LTVIFFNSYIALTNQPGGFMLKKIVAALLLFSMTQVFANQLNSEKREMESQMAQSFDQLNYRLNVEWNQIDGVFFDETMNDFEKQISDLQSKGLSGDDLANFTMSRIKDSASQQEVIKLTSLINKNNMSAADAKAFAISKLNNTYAHGASWSGGKVHIKVALLVAAVIIIAIHVRAKHKDEPTPTTTPEPCYDNYSYEYDYYCHPY
jgi:hypothetical protein